MVRCLQILIRRMKRVIDFLSALNHNNNKVWFDEHKQDYKEVKAYD